MIDVYVYYKVAPAHTADAHRAVAQLLASVAAASGVRGTLSMRVDDPLTWMESYPGVTDAAAFDAALQAAVEASALADCLAGPRHVERFRACA
ncbi:MAG: DUF4936 family protein [Rhodocyclaceae bacterium]|nr:DUF4936 family protein [Rhodocyclaceae bacterium]